MTHIDAPDGVRSRLALGVATWMLVMGLFTGATLGLAGGWLLARAGPLPAGIPVPTEPERGLAGGPAGAGAAGCAISGASAGPGQG